MDIIDEEYLAALVHSATLIVGAKRTGIGVANALSRLGAPYRISDSAPRETLKDAFAQMNDTTVAFMSSPQDASHLDNIGCVIVSPGVPLTLPLFARAKERGIPVIGEIEFVYRLLKNVAFLAITGTDGKTTTTTLLGEMLKTTRPTHTLGNIGTALSSKIFDIKSGDTILLELSSFQLETIQRFRAHIAAVLNVSPDHLDRYSSIDAYSAAKMRITENQTNEDYFITNLDNPYTRAMAEKTRAARLITFSTKDERATFFLKENAVYREGTRLFSLENAKLKGMHNKENILAATAMALAADVPLSVVETTINAFEGVPHRIEFVRALNGIEYYNDSKATTLQAVEKAVEAFDRPIVLIMGGRNKGLDFSSLTSAIKRRVKFLALTGEAAEEIDRQIPFEEKTIAKEFEDAFRAACSAATEGDIVLLSPGCTSFDRFKNFEERGDYFKRLVYALKH